MRLWVFDHYASPPDLPVYARHYQFGRELVQRGHEVVVFAAGFSHRTRREERLRGAQLYRREAFGGVEFVWLRTVPYRGNGLRRVLNMFSYLAIALLVQARLRRPDVIVGTTVHPLAAVAGQITGRLRRAPFLLEISDLWPQTLVDLGAMREGSVPERALRATEAFLVRNARAIISMLPGVAMYLRERGLPADHVVVIPNGTDLAGRTNSTAQADAPVMDVLRKWRSEGRVTFAYIGAHGRANRLEVVVRAAALLESDQIDSVRILLVGDGAEKAMLVRLASDLAVANLHFSEPVPYEELASILDMTDAGLIHGTYSPVHRFGTSFNKLFEYWASSLPVLFAMDVVPDPVRDADAGVSVRPDDPAVLAAALRRMAELPIRERERMGRNGLAEVRRRYDLPPRVQRFEELLMSVVPPGRR